MYNVSTSQRLFAHTWCGKTPRVQTFAEQQLASPGRHRYAILRCPWTRALDRGTTSCTRRRRGSDVTPLHIFIVVAVWPPGKRVTKKICRSRRRRRGDVRPIPPTERSRKIVKFLSGGKTIRDVHTSHYTVVFFTAPRRRVTTYAVAELSD